MILSLLITAIVLFVSMQFHKKGEVLGFLMQLAGALAVAEKVSIGHSPIPSTTMGGTLGRQALSCVPFLQLWDETLAVE